MKSIEYRALHLRMNGELIIACQTSLLKVAYLISIHGALKNKDDLSEEERFCEKTYQEQENLYNASLPFFQQLNGPSKKLSSTLKSLKIVPDKLIDDINLILEFKEEMSNINTTPFYPYGINKKIFKESIVEFYSRLVIIYRIIGWLTDIETGIQLYGIKSYTLSDQDDNQTNIIDGIDDLSLDELKEEAKTLLAPQENDVDFLLEDKAALKDLCVCLEKIGGK